MCTSHACGTFSFLQSLACCCTLQHAHSQRKVQQQHSASRFAASGRACSSALQQVIVASAPAGARLVSLAHAGDGPARMQPRRARSSRVGSRVSTTPAPAGQGQSLLRGPALRHVGCRSRSAVAERLLHWRSAARGRSSLCARRLQAQLLSSGYYISSPRPGLQCCQLQVQKRFTLRQHALLHSQAAHEAYRSDPCTC